MPKISRAPKQGDNTAAPVAPAPNPEAEAIKAADSVVVNKPEEGNPDMTKLPVQRALNLPSPSAPVKRRTTLGSGTVREDR
jgi:hypothetical protein